MFDKQKFNEAKARVEGARSVFFAARKAYEQAKSELKAVRCKHERVAPDPFHEDLRMLVGVTRGKCQDCGAEVARLEPGGSYGGTCPALHA